MVKQVHGGSTVKIAKELQNYLDRNGLIVNVIGSKVAVIDGDGKIIITGATVHTAVKKAIWQNLCFCEDHESRRVRKKMGEPSAE